MKKKVAQKLPNQTDESVKQDSSRQREPCLNVVISFSCD